MSATTAEEWTRWHEQEMKVAREKIQDLEAHVDLLKSKRAGAPAPRNATKPGQIIQIDPDKHQQHGYGGCLLVVEEVRGWGVLGYITERGGVHRHRVHHGDYVVTKGDVTWKV